jgi:hypothetical protein
MQRNRQTAPANVPSTKSTRPNERQLNAPHEKRTLPVPIDAEQLDRVGGGYSAPRNGW